jgi:hypothetical protein
MTKFKRFEIACIGGLGGAVVLIALQLSLGFIVRQLTNGPRHVPYPVIWFLTDAVFGAILGVVSYASLVLVRDDRHLDAAKLCCRGGALMVALTLAYACLGVYNISRFVGIGSTMQVMGRIPVPILLYVGLSSLMLNVAFGWSLLLVGIGRWLRTQEAPFSLR